MNDEVEKKRSGGRNLMILGIVAILAAATTSAVSLYLYHKSGDIYLDCSLPGADCPSARANSEENNREENYTFPDSGNLDRETLEKYLKELESSVNRIDKLENPFESNSLSDEALGI